MAGSDRPTSTLRVYGDGSRACRRARQRSSDGSIGSLDALPAIVEAVGDRAPILLDSGIRGGADIFKALAFGATAVLIGRPYCYGLAVAGESGVREVIQNFTADFDLTRSGSPGVHRSPRSVGSWSRSRRVGACRRRLS
jgi:hypothetical protein